MTDQATTQQDPLQVALAALGRIEQYPQTPADLREVARQAIAEATATKAAQPQAAGTTDAKKKSSALLAMWRESYAAFKGAFDTPLSRRKDKDEFSADARKRMRDFDEAIRIADQIVSIPADLEANSVLAWAEKQLGAEHFVTKALLNHSYAEGLGKKPETSQDWTRLEGAVAFNLIERHADNWSEAGEMMDAWGKARYANVDVLPVEAAALLKHKAETLLGMFTDLECKVCADNISLHPQRNMIQQLVDMTSTLFEPVEALQSQPKITRRDRKSFEGWFKAVCGIANLKRRRPSGQYIDPAAYWAYRAFTAPLEEGELPANFLDNLQLKLEALLMDKKFITAHSNLECMRCGQDLPTEAEQTVVRAALRMVLEAQHASMQS